MNSYKCVKKVNGATVTLYSGPVLEEAMRSATRDLGFEPTWQEEWSPAGHFWKCLYTAEYIISEIKMP